MSITNRNIAIALVLAALVLGSGVLVVKANPSFFVRSTAATGYMTPGTATTTATFDTGVNAAGSVDSAFLALQLTGSTSPFATTNYATTTYNIAIEYSQDSVDWYKDAHTIGTTTAAMNATQPVTRTISLGSTALDANVSGGVALSTTTPTKMIFEVPTPTRYVRAVITIPVSSTGTNGFVRAEFIGKRQAGN